MLYSRIKVVSELVNAAGAPRYGDQAPARGLGLVTQVVVASKTGKGGSYLMTDCMHCISLHCRLAAEGNKEAALIHNRQDLESLLQ
jgi:hypothetical protein